MPIFRHPKGAVLFYAHVPKTGGTYVEMLFRANGFAQHYWNGQPASWGLTISPQHWHRAIFEPMVDLGACRFAFMTVRHPLDRLISEFRSTLGKSHDLGFADWMDGVEARFPDNPSMADNHLRAQVDFRMPGLEVFRQEDEFDADWAAALSDRIGVGFEHLTVERRRHTKSRVRIDLGADDLERAQTFCAAAYAADFAAFGYDMGEAEELARSGRPEE